MKQGVGFAAGAAVVYAAAWALNQALVAGIPSFMGVDIFFLPAGIKLVALLLGGAWGALGVGLAAWLIDVGWMGAEAPMALLEIAVWVGSTYLLVKAVLHGLRVGHDLAGLNARQLMWLVVATSLGNAVINNGWALAIGRLTPDDYLHASMVWATGDMLGATVMLLVMKLVLAMVLRRGGRGGL